MSFLFDTDAVIEAFAPRPIAAYLGWLARVLDTDQFVSVVSVGELYRGALLSRNPEEQSAFIENEMLTRLTELPFDLSAAKVFGRISAGLWGKGQRVEDADLMIAATAIHHGLVLVTGNIRHFARVPGLSINPVLADARKAR